MFLSSSRFRRAKVDGAGVGRRRMVGMPCIECDAEEVSERPERTVARGCAADTAKTGRPTAAQPAKSVAGWA
jgi:hypothetical protein